MSKKQNPKRKAQLNEKARTESFRFQVMWEKSQKLPEMPDENLNAELNALCEKGLAEEMFTLRDIVEGVRSRKRFTGRDYCALSLRDNYDLPEP